jgi:hypothetical protein
MYLNLNFIYVSKDYLLQKWKCCLEISFMYYFFRMMNVSCFYFPNLNFEIQFWIYKVYVGNIHIFLGIKLCISNTRKDQSLIGLVPETNFLRSEWGPHNWSVLSSTAVHRDKRTTSWHAGPCAGGLRGTGRGSTYVEAQHWAANGQPKVNRGHATGAC